MDKRSLVRIERLNYYLGAGLIVIAALTMSREGALGVVVGVILACANFSVLRRIGPGLLRASSGTGAARSLFLIPKIVLLMLAIVLALAFLPISGPGLALGFSVFLPAIVIETIRYLMSLSANEPEM